jgi:hypothetical protein
MSVPTAIDRQREGYLTHNSPAFEHVTCVDHREDATIRR